MTDSNGWPDPTKPGTPLNPERDGWHWVGGFRDKDGPLEWVASQQAWFDAGYWWRPPFDVARYLGTCLTPQEVAAREAAAWCAGRDAAAARALKKTSMNSRGALAAEIRALTPPASYAAALEAARREEREACAKIAESKALPAPWTSQHEGAKQFGSTIAAAIRARGEESGQ